MACLSKAQAMHSPVLACLLQFSNAQFRGAKILSNAALCQTLSSVAETPAAFCSERLLSTTGPICTDTLSRVFSSLLATALLKHLRHLGGLFPQGLRDIGQSIEFQKLLSRNGTMRKALPNQALTLTAVWNQ